MAMSLVELGGIFTDTSQTFAGNFPSWIKLEMGMKYLGILEEGYKDESFLFY